MSGRVCGVRTADCATTYRQPKGRVIHHFRSGFASTRRWRRSAVPKGWRSCSTRWTPPDQPELVSFDLG